MHVCDGHAYSSLPCLVLLFHVLLFFEYIRPTIGLPLRKRMRAHPPARRTIVIVVFSDGCHTRGSKPGRAINLLIGARPEYSASVHLKTLSMASCQKAKYYDSTNQCIQSIYVSSGEKNRPQHLHGAECCGGKQKKHVAANSNVYWRKMLRQRNDQLL